MIILCLRDEGYPVVHDVEIIHRGVEYVIPSMTRRSLHALERAINRKWVGKAWKIVKKNKGYKIPGRNDICKG